MPQGEHTSTTASGAPAPPRPSRRPRAPHVGPVIGPKTAAGALGVNMAFRAGLHTMTRNIEMIAAGKLAQAGGFLRTGDLKRAAGSQLAFQRELDADKKVGSAVTATAGLLAKAAAGGRIKGMRGPALELDELVGLVPALKAHVDAAKKSAATSRVLNAERRLSSGGLEEVAAGPAPGAKRRRAEASLMERAITGAAEPGEAVGGEEGAPSAKRPRPQPSSTRGSAPSAEELQLAPLFGGAKGGKWGALQELR